MLRVTGKRMKRNKSNDRNLHDLEYDWQYLTNWQKKKLRLVAELALLEQGFYKYLFAFVVFFFSIVTPFPRRKPSHWV